MKTNITPNQHSESGRASIVVLIIVFIIGWSAYNTHKKNLEAERQRKEVERTMDMVIGVGAEIATDALANDKSAASEPINRELQSPPPPHYPSATIYDANGNRVGTVKGNDPDNR